MNGLNKEIIDKFNDIITQYKFDKKIIDELAITRIIDRMSDTFNVDYNTLEKLIKQESGEAFVEHEHPRDRDGKFTTKDDGVNNSLPTEDDYTEDNLTDELYLGKFEDEFLEIVHKAQLEDKPDKLFIDLKEHDDYAISLAKQGSNDEINSELKSLRHKRDIIALDEKYDDIYNLKTIVSKDKVNEIMSSIGREVTNLNDVKESELDKLTPMEKAIFDKVKRLQNELKNNKDIRKIGWTDDNIDYNSVLLYHENMAKSHMYSKVDKSDIMHVELYNLVKDKMDKKLDDISAKYGYDVKNAEHFGKDPDKWFNLTSKEKVHIEKYLQYNLSKPKVDNANEYKNRIGNEILTPMINENIHMYYVKEEEDHIEGDTSLLQFAYNEMYQVKQKNYWTKDLGRQMNLTLNQGRGEEVGKIGDKIQGVASGTWVQQTNNMNIYGYHPRQSFARPSLAQTLSHELTHSVYSTRVKQAEKDPIVKEQMTRLTDICEKLDPRLVGKYLGTYAKSYVDEFNENGREGYGSNIETEMLSAITDAINPRKFYRFKQIKNVKRGLRKYFPELMKVYKELMGKDKWDNTKKNRQQITRMNQGESYDNISITYDLQYLDDDRNIVPIEKATHGIRKGYIGNKVIYFEVIILNKEYNESFKEEDHPRDEDGKFADKDGGSVSGWKETTMKDVETKPEIKDKQKKIDRNVTNKVEDAIKELGIEDKIYDVAMQGSYEKGTDLPASGSDMDLFVVFNTNVSEEEKNQYGLEIGRKVLNKDFAESQGWTDYYDEEVTATSKYVQAFFKDGEQEVEVQIVPTKHLTLEQIRDRKLDGKDIEIGMERTPHQTEYMKTALKGKEGEVRVLKHFMKKAGLYGSNLKQQGFSGYSAEVLIDKYDSFENVIDFFANLKEGDIVDKQGGGKRNKENAFSIIDPIDPNRDLVSAFSTQKIGKTVNVAKKFKETGTIPDPEYREMDSTIITFDSDEMNEDKLIGQVRRMANSYQSVLGKMGFNIETNTDKVNGIDVELPNFSFDAEWDNDKKKNIVKLSLGSNNMTIPETSKDKGISLSPPTPKIPKEAWDKNIQKYRDNNKGSDFVEEDGKLKVIRKNQFTNMTDAIDYLNKNPEGKLVNTNQTEQIKSNGRVSTGKSEFQNI